jgi:hypothetical protein
MTEPAIGPVVFSPPPSLFESSGGVSVDDGGVWVCVEVGNRSLSVNRGPASGLLQQSLSDLALQHHSSVAHSFIFAQVSFLADNH